jgi:hypothetical protein
MTVSFHANGQVRLIGTVTYFAIVPKADVMHYGTAEPFRVTPP